MITDYAKNRVSLLIGGSISNTDLVNHPGYFMIGTGSSTVQNSGTTLLTASDRQADTSVTFNGPIVTWVGDWNFLEMSGLSLKEYGKTGSATGLTGSMWSRTVIPSLTFQGNEELRVEEAFTVY